MEDYTVMKEFVIKLKKIERSSKERKKGDSSDRKVAILLLTKNDRQILNFN